MTSTQSVSQAMLALTFLVMVGCDNGKQQGADTTHLSGRSATIGVENESGSTAVQHAYNTSAAVAAGQGLTLVCP